MVSAEDKDTISVRAHTRKPAYPVNELILSRWSARAMSGESLTDAELMALFEAARWAPSSYNNQPWRFIYAKRGTPAWDVFLDLLVPFNRQWAQHASVLVVIVSKNTFDHNGKPSDTHSFDTGAAWQNLALQAETQNLVAHGMQGFDYDKAHKALNIPDGYTVEAMCAIGKPGKLSGLSEELRTREVPSERKPLTALVFEGSFIE